MAASNRLRGKRNSIIVRLGGGSCGPAASFARLAMVAVPFPHLSRNGVIRHLPVSLPRALVGSAHCTKLRSLVDRTRRAAMVDGFRNGHGLSNRVLVRVRESS